MPGLGMQNWRVERNKRSAQVPGIRYVIPNAFTATSLLLGLGSIVAAQLGEIELAGWMIVWCGLLDVCDGLAARLLNATSSFGAEFDSMADLVSFGVAPAMLVFHAGIDIGGVEVGSGAFWLLVVAGGVFALCAAMRLARFNLGTQLPRGRWFYGLPTTAAGGGLTATSMILLTRYDALADALNLAVVLPVMLAGLGIAMVSTLRFPKLMRRDSKAFNVFMISSASLSYVCGIFRIFPEYLFGLAIFLTVSGLIAGLLAKE